MQLNEHVGQGIDLGHLLRAARDVELDPIARRKDHELVARERSAQSRPSALPYLAAVEGNRFADRGRRRTVIDPQGQQSHGVFDPPGRSKSRSRRGPWAAGARRRRSR